MKECLSPEQWGTLADPDGTDPDRGELLAHAVQCRDCARVLELFDTIPLALERDPWNVKRDRRPLAALATAAAIFLLALPAVWWLASGDNGSRVEGVYRASGNGGDTLPQGRLLTAGDRGLVVTMQGDGRIEFAAASTLRWDGGPEVAVERGEVTCIGPDLRLRVPGGRITGRDAHFEVVVMKHASQVLFVTVMTGTISFAADQGNAIDLARGDSLRISSAGGWTVTRQDSPPPAPLEDFEKLLADLKSGDPQVRSDARQSLRRLGPAALPLLEKALQDAPDSPVREQLTTVIRQIEEERESDFQRLIVHVITVRRGIEEGARSTGVEESRGADCEIRLADIPRAARLREILGLDDPTVGKIEQAFADVEAKRLAADTRIDAILARWRTPPGDDPIAWKEWIAVDYPVLSNDWATIQGLPKALSRAIESRLGEADRRRFEQELDERLAEKIYRQILPKIRFYYAGDPPNHEGLGAGRLLGMGKGILPGLRRARADERFPLKDRQRLDEILRELEK